MASVFLGGSAMLAAGILGVLLWTYRDLDAHNVMLALREDKSIFAPFIVMLAASTVLAFLAARFSELTPVSRCWVLCGSVVTAAAVCLSINWFFALFLALGALLLAIAWPLGSQSHA